MSHVASVNCFVTELADARAAALACGFTFMENQRSYKWYGRFMNDSNLAPGHDPKTFGQCQHALRLKDHTSSDYEIGLVPRVDGQPGWELLYDNFASYGRRLEEKAGASLVTLKNEILAAATIRTMQRQGFRVARTVDAAGDIQLLAREVTMQRNHPRDNQGR